MAAGARAPPQERTPQKTLRFFRLYITSISPASIGTAIETVVNPSAIMTYYSLLRRISARLPDGPEKVRRARPKEGKRQWQKTAHCSSGG
jgi:hypothetical protein